MVSTNALRYVAEDASTGYGDAADRLVRAVRALGVTVEFRGWSDTYRGAAPAFTPFSRDELPELRVADGAPTVAHLVPEYYPLVRSVAPPGAFVAHTVWETDRLPHHWPALLNDTDLVIVPTDWNREVFEAGGVRVPVRVVPHVACDPVPGDGGAALDLPDDVVVFYAIGRWDQRKAMFHTVEAFLRAFTIDDPVVLVVKTAPHIEMPPAEEWGASNPRAFSTGWQMARLVSRHARPPMIRLEVAEWTDEQIAGLHARGDCYVTLTHGEGWGIGAFDACAYGNPVVATEWGGLLAFLDGDGASLVRATEIPVEHIALTSYSVDQQWAEPDIDHAVEFLRAVAADPEGARRRAAPLRDRVLTEFAGPVVARTFLDVIDTVRS